MPKAQRQEIRTDSAPRKHNVAEAASLTENQQLLSHTRGWKKRYISTGVGNKLPLSTRGTVFVSLFGNVVIDLAKVHTASIFDLHSPAAAAMNLEVSPDLVVSQGSGYPATDYAGEAFLGLRDVLRTRELVIKREVELKAVIRHKVDKRILGIGFGARDDRLETLKAALATPSATLPIPQPENTEPENFVWSDGKKWFFALYKSEPDCQAAFNAANLAYPDLAKNKDIKQINQYTYTVPLGMVVTT
jgi:hypothetical protein